MYMNAFTTFILILLILSIVNNLIMYSSSYHKPYVKDPLLPDNIGVLRYNVYYNIQTTQALGFKNHYDPERNISGISVKNDLDEMLNTYQKDNVGRCLIVSEDPTAEDYNKIQRISDTMH